MDAQLSADLSAKASLSTPSPQLELPLEAAAISPGLPPWVERSFPAVTFMCWEDHGRHEQRPLWGTMDSLQVGLAIVAWDGLGVSFRVSLLCVFRNV